MQGAKVVGSGSCAVGNPFSHSPQPTAHNPLFPLLSLIRFHYHCSFVIVLLGVLTVTRRFTFDLIASLALLYVSFNVLLYGGIYAINAVADAREDRLHARKKNRPVASGTVSRGSAARFAAVLLAVAFATGFGLFGPRLGIFYAAFLAVNLIYTFVAKRVAFAELAFNAGTYPLRYLMGAWVAGGRVSPFLPGLVFLVAVGACTVRRSVEGSPRYSRAVLIAIEIAAFACIAALRLLDAVNHNVFYYCAGGTYAVLVFGTEFASPMRRAFLRFWTK